MTTHDCARVRANCHVYYRVRADQVSQAGKAVIALMQVLRERTGVQGSLSCRVAQAGDQSATDPASRDRGGDGAPTWMETYPGVRDRTGFERHMDAAVRSSAFAQYLPEGARRNLEWFEPVDFKDAA